MRCTLLLSGASPLRPTKHARGKQAINYKHTHRVHARAARRGTYLRHDHRLVGRNQILDVNKGIFASVHFKKLERLVDQRAEILVLLLVVVDAVSNVRVEIFKDVVG